MERSRALIGFLLAGLLLAWTARCRGQWQPAENVLMTPWAEQLSPQNVHAEYPRPQMVRDRWQSLNGLWQYAIEDRGENTPRAWEGDILVPFCVESALSGVKRRVGPAQRLWYRHTFTTARLAKGWRLLLHFGAVDWQTVVWVNGQRVGEHQGGYDPFTFDITDALNDKNPQELVAAVWDPTDHGTQPRGKQKSEPESIWYTPVTGIWQSVWLEPVPAVAIESLRIVPDVDAGVVRVTAVVPRAGAVDRITVRVASNNDDAEIGSEDLLATATGPPNEPIEVAIEHARLWSPDDPHLYGLVVELHGAQQQEPALDRVGGYFRMRKIEVRQDNVGIARLFLNNRPLFQYGPLDQGWWPDGLYTAPTDEALQYDIRVTKQLGFNMIRKHVKVEPARWYYHCDRLGMLVWQDMPSGMDREFGPQHVQRGAQQDADMPPAHRRQLETELRALIDHHQTFPCIVMWVPFNEGWGQYETARIAAWVKSLDPTRLCDAVSGWEDRGVGDVYDRHSYPGPEMFPVEPRRASVLGEFGGLGLPLEGHLWIEGKKNWGYRTYQNKAELQDHYAQLIGALRPMIERGLAAAVYTQTTDVEREVNGLLTYDRRVLKFDAERIGALHRGLYAPTTGASSTAE